VEKNVGRAAAALTLMLAVDLILFFGGVEAVGWGVALSSLVEIECMAVMGLVEN
jgi:hypothetical protein